MAETPRRGGPTLVGTSAVSCGAASGTWTILRSIHITNELDVVVKVTVGVHTSAADAAGRRVLKSVELDPGEAIPYQCYIPMSGTDLVYAIADQAAAATVTVGFVDGP